MQAVRTPTRPLATVNEKRQNELPAAAQTRAAPKKKMKPSELCNTPPTTIQNKHGQSYARGLCIGEGGFARCFQVNDGNGVIYAAKTLAKLSLKSEKTRAKLLTEIKIHRALKHANVVQFIDCFEDDANVYILLEMCANQSLMDMVRRRKRLTETEARFFMLQLLGAIHYMHSRLVVHRDLKLGNIFIDSDMNLKIGDFGLAARLDSLAQRRKTVCGTPNYISPEVLLRPHEHSFPADIWAAGIILYAMLYGNPPFQEKNVDVIYQRIKHHDLRFPTNSSVTPSDAARDLIKRMLDPDQYRRATVEDILSHEWMNTGSFVSSIPVTALRQEPYLFANQEDSRANLEAAKVACGLALSEDARAAAVEPVTATEILEGDAGTHILPHHISPPSTKDKYQVVALPGGKKAMADYDSPVVSRGVRRTDRHRVTSGNVVAAPAAVRTSTSHASAAGTGTGGAAAAAAAATRIFSGGTTYSTMVSSIAAPPRPSSNIGTGRPASSGSRNVEEPVHASLRSISETVEALLNDPNAEPASRPSSALRPPVYITKWADFDETWGLAYGLTDGAVGVLFRDGTSMRMDPVFNTFMYYEQRSRPGYVTLHRTAADTPDRRRSKKVDVMKFVHGYMDQRLGQAATPARPGGDCCDGTFVFQFKRLSQFIMFVLSDGTLQFNFRDHNKIVLNKSSLTLITDQRQVLTWPLDTALHATRGPHFGRLGLASKLDAILEAINDSL